MASTRGQGSLVENSELQPRRSDITDTRRPPERQLALFERGPNPWSRAHRAVTWLEIARALPANLGVETTDGVTWRIVNMPLATRRALEALDIAEGDVIPDDVMREQRRRTLHADLQLQQARAVLRSVQAENETAAALRRGTRHLEVAG